MYLNKAVLTVLHFTNDAEKWFPISLKMIIIIIVTIIIIIIIIIVIISQRAPFPDQKLKPGMMQSVHSVRLHHNQGVKSFLAL